MERSIEIIEKFQCPGCSCGTDHTCGKYRLFDDGYGFCCSGHCPSTFMSGAGRILLGMPKGFNRPGRGLNKPGEYDTKTAPFLRFWQKGSDPQWDKFNIPIWALEQDGFLFVRTVSPRIGYLYVDVIEGGTLAMVPKAINVAEFLEEMD